MVSDDFSFPTMSYQLQDMAVTPSLWPVHPPDCYEESSEGELAGEDDQYSACEEKMDMLWEDFNEEELQRVCSMKGMKTKDQKEAAAVKSPNEQSAAGVKIVEVCCMQATRNNRTIYDKRYSKPAGLAIKFLKKLFSATAAQIRKN